MFSRKIVIWLFLLFIAYAMFSSFLSRRGQDLSDIPEVAGEATDEVSKVAKDVKRNWDNYQQQSKIVESDPRLREGGFFEKTIRKAFKPLIEAKLEDALKGKALPLEGDIHLMVEGIVVQDLEVGSGPSAYCGQEVTVHYSAELEDGTLVEHTQKTNSPVTFQIGKHQVIPGLELGVMGMHQGGKRVVNITPIHGYDNPHFYRQDVAQGSKVHLGIQLLKVTPPRPQPMMPLKKFVTKIGVMDQLTCGKKAKIQLILHSVDGKQIADLPLTMTLGDSHLPWGVEDGMNGMFVGETRTLIIPPELLAFRDKTQSRIPNSVILPKGQVLLAEVSVLQLL